MSRIAGHFTYIAVVTVVGTALLVAVPASAAERVRVGEAPYISAGGFFIARDKGYFLTMGIEIETRTFQDGSLAVPSVVSGKLEFAAMVYPFILQRILSSCWE